MIQTVGGGPYYAFTEVLVTGSEEEVRADVERYFKDYPRMGYATNLKDGPRYLGGGVWEARIERYSVCE